MYQSFVPNSRFNEIEINHDKLLKLKRIKIDFNCSIVKFIFVVSFFIYLFFDIWKCLINSFYEVKLLYCDVGSDSVIYIFLRDDRGL